MSREVDVKMQISILKDIERRVSLRAQKMLAAIKCGSKLDEDLLNGVEVHNLRKHKVISSLKEHSEVATKSFLDGVIEEIDDISLLTSIELANENITPGYYQQIKHLKHKVLLTRKNIEQYNIPEIARHVDATLRCIDSSTRIKYNYNATKKPQHSDKTRQYTVTKPARYVPFPMR